MRRSMPSAVLACLGSLAATLAAAQSPPMTPVGPGTSAISGRVTDAKTGEPIAGVSLAIHERERRQHLATSSKLDGTYAFEGIAAGKYGLTAEKPGYVSQVFGTTSIFDGPGTPIELGAGQRAERIDLAMPPGAIVRGRVTDENGQAIVRVTVMVGRRRTSRDDIVGVVRPAEANERGEYEVADLPEGDLYVVARGLGVKPGPIPRGAKLPDYERTFYPGVTSLDEATTIRTTAGEVTTGVDFAVRHRSSMTSLPLRVVHPSGAIPASVEVVVAAVEGGTSHQFRPRALSPDGRVTADRLSPGPYVAWARAVAGRSTHEAGVAFVNVDTATPEVTLTLEPVATLSGRVIIEDGPPAPISALRISAILHTPAGPLRVPPSLGGIDAAPVAADGRFELQGLFGERILRVDAAASTLAVKRIDLNGQSLDPQSPIALRPGQHLPNVTIVVGPRP